MRTIWFFAYKLALLVAAGVVLFDYYNDQLTAPEIGLWLGWNILIGVFLIVNQLATLTASVGARRAANGGYVGQNQPHWQMQGDARTRPHGGRAAYDPKKPLVPDAEALKDV